VRGLAKDNAALAAQCLLDALHGDTADDPEDHLYVRQLVGAIGMLEAMVEIRRLREAWTKG
jgi:hypothetical protein